MGCSAQRSWRASQPAASSPLAVRVRVARGGWLRGCAHESVSRRQGRAWHQARYDRRPSRRLQLRCQHELWQSLNEGSDGMKSRRSYRANYGGQLTGGLASAVWIVTAKPVVFAIAVIPVAVGVHLIGGHHHDNAVVDERFKGFQQMQRALHVRSPGTERVAVAATHQWLSC